VNLTYIFTSLKGPKNPLDILIENSDGLVYTPYNFHFIGIKPEFLISIYLVEL